MIFKSSKKIEKGVGAMGSRYGEKDLNRIAFFSFQSILKESVNRSITGRKTVTSNLKMSQFTHLKSEDFKEVFCKFPHVKNLDMSGCYQVTKESIEAIANEYGDKLHTLNLEFCHYITDADVSTLFGECKEELEKKKRLEMTSLNLSYTNISDAGMRTITTSCPNLKVLKLRGMKNISNYSLSMIAKYCKNITHLDLQGCTKITDFGISILSQELKGLEQLYVNDCINLSNEIIPYICYYNISLKEIDLRNTKIGGESLVFILTNLVHLEVLKVAGLSLNSGSTHPFENMKCLKTLDISFCYNLKNLLVDIVKSCTTLVEVYMYGLITIEEKMALSSINPSLSIYC